MATAFEIHIPNLGESISEATIARWAKNDGDTVGSEDVIAELETDKATLELSPVQAGMASGKSGVLRLKVAKGKTVNVGDVIAVIEESAAGKPVANANGATGAQAAQDARQDEAARSTGSSGAVSAAAETKANLDLPLAPAVRVLVEEKKLDAAKIPATGKDGRITKEDVLNFIQQTGPTQASDSAAASQSRDARSGQTQQGATTAGTTTQPLREKQVPSAPAPAAGAPQPAQTKSSDGEQTREPMSKLRQTIARRLVEAQHTAAMLTTSNEVDMTAVMALRDKYKEGFEKTHKVKLGFMSFFAKASIAALKAIPAVNAQIDGTDIVYHKHVHLGIAVSTPRGLVVPVIRHADQLSMAQIESEIVRLATKGRDGKLSVDDMSGGTFTITNGGIYGSLFSTPIINPPQSAILGMHKIQKRPIAIDDQVVVRPMMYLAVSYDHRVIDGAQAVTFLVRIKDALEDPARLVLEI